MNIKISPWLDNLPYEWSIYEKHGTKIELDKNSYIFHTGDNLNDVYIVLEGRVRLYLFTEDGKEKTITIIGKNGLLGEYFLVPSHKYNTTAITVSNVKLLKVNKFIFEEIALTNELIIKQWLEMLSMKLEILTHSSLNLSFDSSRERIIKTFIHLVTTYGVRENSNYMKITISFTHQELADLIGMSRVTVSNEISKLEQQKLIYKKEQYYYIKDGLENYSNLII